MTPKEKFNEAIENWEERISNSLNNREEYEADIAFKRATLLGLKSIDDWLEQIYMAIPE